VTWAAGPLEAPGRSSLGYPWAFPGHPGSPPGLKINKNRKLRNDKDLIGLCCPRGPHDWTALSCTPKRKTAQFTTAMRTTVSDAVASCSIPSISDVRGSSVSDAVGRSITLSKSDVRALGASLQASLSVLARVRPRPRPPLQPTRRAAVVFLFALGAAGARPDRGALLVVAPAAGVVAAVPPDVALATTIAGVVATVTPGGAVVATAAGVGAAAAADGAAAASSNMSVDRAMGDHDGADGGAMPLQRNDP
jgi:hypothetical protein